MSGMARSRSAASRVSMSAGEAAGEEAAEAEGGSWASPSAAAARKIVRLALRTRRGIGRLDVSRNRGKSNVATIVAAFEIDFPDGLVSQVARCRYRVAERGHGQDSAAAAENAAVLPACPGMENVHVLHLRAGVEAGDFLPCFDVARVAGRGHHHR